MLIVSFMYYYNTERLLHGSLGNVSPDTFTRQWSDAQRQYETRFLREETIANKLAIPVQFIGGETLTESNSPKCS